MFVIHLQKEVLYFFPQSHQFYFTSYCIVYPTFEEEKKSSAKGQKPRPAQKFAGTSPAKNPLSACQMGRIKPAQRQQQRFKCRTWSSAALSRENKTRGQLNRLQTRYPFFYFVEHRKTTGPVLSRGSCGVKNEDVSENGP